MKDLVKNCLAENKVKVVHTGNSIGMIILMSIVSVIGFSLGVG